MNRRDPKVESLLSSFVQNDTVFREICLHIEKEVFIENEYNNFLSEARRFYKANNKRPTLDEFCIFTDILKFPFLRDIYITPVDLAKDIAINGFYKCYQINQSMQFLETVSQQIEAGSFDMESAHDELKRIVLSTKRDAQDFTEISSSNAIAEYRMARDFRIENTSPLIFKGISRLANGGIAKGELEIFIAPPSRGKTLYLVNECYNGLLHGEKCLYITMENLKDSTNGRLSDRILLMDKDEQRKNQLFCETFIKKFYHYVQPPIIMYRPANTLTVEDIDVWLDEYEARTGQGFDRIFVDYMNKMKKPKGDESWDRERLLTDGLRALAIKRGTRIITAAQTSREGTNIGKEGGSDSIDEGMIQGGFGQFETADIVLGLSETPMEKQRGAGRIVLLKARESGGRGREFVCTVAPWIGLLTDHAEDIIPEHKKYVLENPDARYGQLSGLHPKRDKAEGKTKGEPKAADTSKKKKGDDGIVQVDGVTI